jgi:hypothetical protein
MNVDSKFDRWEEFQLLQIASRKRVASNSLPRSQQYWTTGRTRFMLLQVCGYVYGTR